MIKKKFAITVNYDVPVEEAIKSLCIPYKLVDRDINSQNFETQRNGKVNIRMELIRFNQKRSYQHEYHHEVIKKITIMGYRPAEIHELVALGSQYPHVNRDHGVGSVIALGSTAWRRRGEYFEERLNPVLTFNHCLGERELWIHSYTKHNQDTTDSYDDFYWFVVLKK